MTLLQPLGEVRGPQTPEPMSALSSEALLREGGRQGREDNGQTVKERVIEQVWHTHLARYLAMGMNQAEAAAACDCAPNTVSFLLSTPWFQERVSEQMKLQGSDIMALFKGAGMSAFATIVEVMENAKAPPAVRVNAAKEIIERVLGKSTQYVEVKATGAGDPVAEAQALEAELNALRQDKTLTVLPPVAALAEGEAGRANTRSSGPLAATPSSH